MENTIDGGSITVEPQDHLHLRGEYIYLSWDRPRGLGSSPLTWRIQEKLSSSYIDIGIISTYVENTLLAKYYSKWVKDHLHLRGEYLCLK